MERPEGRPYGPHGAGAEHRFPERQPCIFGGQPGLHPGRERCGRGAACALGYLFRPHVLRTVLGAGTVRLGLPVLRRPGGKTEAEKVVFHCIFCRTLL